MPQARVKQLRPEMLLAKGGAIYCHVFENPFMGVARDLFWSVTVDFEQFKFNNEESACSMTCEWLRWPIRSWLGLDGCAVDFQYGEQGYESSFYLFEHHPASHTRLRLTHDSANIFTAEISMQVPMPANLGIEVEDPLEITAVAQVPFIGLLMTPGNAAPKPITNTQLQQLAMDFVDVNEFHPPEPYNAEPYNGGLRFRPKW